MEVYIPLLSGRYNGNEISHNLWLWLKGHTDNFMSLISVYGEKGPNKFSHKGNLLAFGGVVSASAHPELSQSKDPYKFYFHTALYQSGTASHFMLSPLRHWTPSAND